MIQKIIILGFLKEGKHSGYEIKKFMAKELGIFTSPHSASIYYPLKVMEKEGLITKKVVAGKTHMDKYVYNITPQGERVFMKLATDNLLSMERPFISLDVSLYFLPYLDKKKTFATLRLRTRVLEKVKKWLKGRMQKAECKEKAHLKMVLTHHFTLATAEIKFTKEFIRFLKKS